MTINDFKYIVTLEGVSNPLEFNTLNDAFSCIRIAMPCKATIKAEIV